MCPILTGMNKYVLFSLIEFLQFFDGICVPSSRLFTVCVLMLIVPGCVLYFPVIGHMITYALNGAQIRHIWMCLFEFALAKRVADSEHSGVRSLRSLASLENIESMSLSSPVSTARAAALQPPWTRRSTAAADEDVLLEFAWVSPRRAWSTGRARASFSLRGPSHPCQRSQRQRTWAHCPRTWRQTSAKRRQGAQCGVDSPGHAPRFLESRGESTHQQPISARKQSDV